MAKKSISKISDKLAKVSDSFTVQMYDNGFMFEISGRNEEEDWRSVKILCNTQEQLIALINETTEMTRDE
jgi:hypothetical protein